jgi:accessory gene regulator B
MGANQLERAADAIGRFLADQLEMDQDRREIVSYGALTFLQNGSSLALLLVLSALAGSLPQALVALGAAGLMRHAGGGVHLRTPLRCVAATSLAFTLAGLGGRLLGSAIAPVPVWARLLAVLTLAAAGLAPVLRYAPVAAENRPLSAGHRAQLRRLSLRLGGAVVALLALGALLGAWWMVPGLLGFLVQSFTLTPAGHKAADALDCALGFPREEV